MRITRTIAVLSLFTATAVVACSDSGPFQPEAQKSLLGSTTGGGGTDTAGHTPPDTSHHTPPDTGSHTGPDTVGHSQGSLDPRTIVGTVNGIGAQADTSKYELVAGATVVLSTPDDTTAGTTGKELARAVTKSDGSFALGAFKPGIYQVAVTPAAGSPFGAKRWAFQISQYAPATFPLVIWLNRK